MLHAYDDEDNSQMNDEVLGEDPWLKYTTYSCKAEEDAWESGEIDRRLEMMEEARDIRRSQIREGFLDDLEIPRGSRCRECEWMQEGVIERFEDDVDDDLVMNPDAYDLAHRMCAVCNAHSEEERDDALQEFFEKEDAGDGTDS